MKKIIIIGGGLAGLSAAYHLKKDYALYEKENEPGGLARSRHTKGFTFDYTGHLLHFKTQYVKNLVERLLGENLVWHSRNSSVYLLDRHVQYPFQANLYGLPDEVIKECVRDFRKVNAGRRAGAIVNSSFAHWLEMNFGEGMARYFFFPYNRKFWGFPLEKISCEWVDGLIPRVSLREVLNGAGGLNRKGFGYNRTFAYPKTGGIQSLPRAFSAYLKGVHTGKELKEVDVRNKRASFKDGEETRYTHLINTVPLPELIRRIKGVPAKVKDAADNLRWTSILNINLGINGALPLNNHWVYYPEKKFSFYRTGFPSNFSDSVCPGGKSSIYIEISKKMGTDTDFSSEKIIGELKRASILSGEDEVIVKDINPIKYAYPVHDFFRGESVRIIMDFLRENNIHSIGRFGRWEYLTMEQSILDGKYIAEELNGN